MRIEDPREPVLNARQHGTATLLRHRTGLRRATPTGSLWLSRVHAPGMRFRHAQMRPQSPDNVQAVAGNGRVPSGDGVFRAVLRPHVIRWRAGGSLPASHSYYIWP